MQSKGMSITFSLRLSYSGLPYRAIKTFYNRDLPMPSPLHKDYLILVETIVLNKNALDLAFTSMVTKAVGLNPVRDLIFTYFLSTIC